MCYKGYLTMKMIYSVFYKTVSNAGIIFVLKHYPTKRQYCNFWSPKKKKNLKIRCKQKIFYRINALTSSSPAHTGKISQNADQVLKTQSYTLFRTQICIMLHRRSLKYV